MLNNVVLIGRLTKDPELRYTPSGIAVTQFTLAVDRIKVKDQPQVTDFIPIVVWRQSAENCANYLRKGRLTAVRGRIQTRDYENNEGRKVYVTEVHAEEVKFLESINRDNRQNSDNSSPESNPFTDDGKPIDITDDDLPF